MEEGAASHRLGARKGRGSLWGPPGGVHLPTPLPPGLAHCGVLTSRTLRGWTRAMAALCHSSRGNWTQSLSLWSLEPCPPRVRGQTTELSQNIGASAVPLGDGCPPGPGKLHCPGSHPTGSPSLCKVSPGTPQVAGPPPGTGTLDSETAADAVPSWQHRVRLGPRHSMAPGPSRPVLPRDVGGNPPRPGTAPRPEQAHSALSPQAQLPCPKEHLGPGLRRDMPVVLRCPQLRHVTGALATPKHATPTETGWPLCADAGLGPQGAGRP